MDLNKLYIWKQLEERIANIIIMKCLVFEEMDGVIILVWSLHNWNHHTVLHKSVQLLCKS